MNPTDDTARGISAAFLAAATNGDPQFALPENPCLVPSLQRIWLDDGLVVDGGVSRRYFRGHSVMGVLPALMPLLNGVRTQQELARDSGLPEIALRQVLSTMFAAGMLIDGETASNGDPADAFFERATDASRRNRSSSEARAKLMDRPVLVVGTSRAAEAVRTALTESQVTVAREHAPIPEVFLCVAVDLEADARDTIERWARAARTPILPIRFGRVEATVGPMSYHDYGPCLACIEYAYPARGGTPPEEGLRALAMLAAIEIVLLISDVGRPTVHKSAVAVAASDLATTTRRILQRPGCRTCGAGIDVDVATELAYRYESSVEFPPGRLVNPRDHQGHFESSSVRLTYDRRSFPGVPTIALSTARLSEDDSEARSLQTLGRLLLHSFGFKPEEEQAVRPRRWAPSGGNLGSPQAYLTIEGLPGIADGDYAYVASEHVLAQLATFDRTVAPMSSAPSVELYIASELERVWKKYAAFAYRVTALDAGVAIAHLALMASTSSLTLTVHPGWNEVEAGRRFAIDRSQQSVSAHVTIGGFE